MNQGQGSNLWFTGDVSSWWTVWRVWAPAVMLLIPHSLSVLVLRHDRFLFLLYCMSSSHSICPLSHSRRRLSLTLLYEPKRWSQPNLYDERCLAEPGRSHTYNKSRQRYIIKQKHHNSRPHDWCYTSSKSYISTDWSIINKLIWSHVHLQKLEAIRS